MELFAHTLRFNRKNEAIEFFSGERNDTSINFSVPNSNFNTFLEATVTVFIFIANDGWTPVFFDHYRVNGGLVSSIFFISLIIFG